MAEPVAWTPPANGGIVRLGLAAMDRHLAIRRNAGRNVLHFRDELDISLSRAEAGSRPPGKTREASRSFRRCGGKAVQRWVGRDRAS